MDPRDCPTPDRLAAWLLGNLPGPDLDAVGEHVDACTRCEQLAAQLEQAGDSLVSGLRHAAPPAPASAPVAHTPPTSRLPIGMELGQYRLLHLLGRGGMGAVYRARHVRLGRMVAVKVLASQRLGDPEAVARFRREVKAAGSLNHPNIVQASDAGEAGGTPFLVMELIEGVDLGRLVRRLGRPGIADACEAIRQAALGLHHAHTHGLVHRDVKPSNLLLGRSWGETGSPAVKVLDLGLALRKTDVGMTNSNALLGTRDYIAPEQWDDTHNVDARTDLYSLGCTLFHLLAGRPPFAGPGTESLLQKRWAHVEGPVPSVRERRAEVPEALDRLLRRMLAKRPADRPGTALAAAESLAPFTAGADLAALWQTALRHPDADRDAEAHRPTGRSTGGSTTAGVLPPGLRPPRVVRRRSWALPVALVFVAAALAAFGLWMASGRADRPLGRHGVSRALAFAPDGRWAVTGGDDGAVRVWDLSTQAERVTLMPTEQRPDGNRDPVTAVAVGGDGATVYAAAGQRVYAWDSRTDRLRDHHDFGWPVAAIAVTADGRTLFAGGGTTDPPEWRLATRDLKTGDVAEQTGTGAAVTALAAAPIGVSAAAGTADGRLIVWHPPAPPLTRGEAGNAVVGVHFTPDGSWVVACSAGSAREWSAANGMPGRLLSLGASPAVHTALTPDGKHLLAAGQDGALRCFDVSDGKLELTLPGHEGPAGGVAWSADGRHALSAGADRAVRFWSLPVGPAPSAKP